MSECDNSPVILWILRFTGKNPGCENRQNIASWKQVQRAYFGYEWSILMSALGVGRIDVGSSQVVDLDVFRFWRGRVVRLDVDVNNLTFLVMGYTLMIIEQVFERKKDYVDLLLLADEQESMVDRYLERGNMFVLDDSGVKAECVVTKESDGIYELKNIAVHPDHQRKGYGKRLIDIYCPIMRIVRFCRDGRKRTYVRFL